MGLVASSPQTSEVLIDDDDSAGNSQGAGQVPRTKLVKQVRLTPTAEALTLPETTLKCPVFTCKEGMSHKNTLEHHIATHVRELVRIEGDLVLQYHCPADNCVYNIHKNDQCFVHLKKLKQHYCKMHLVKKLKCDTCEKTFSTPSYLREHEKSCGVIFKCSSCKKEYKYYVSLKRHAVGKSHTYDIEKYCPRKMPKSSSSTVTAAPTSCVEDNNTISTEASSIPLFLHTNSTGLVTAERAETNHPISTQTASFPVVAKRDFPGLSLVPGPALNQEGNFQVFTSSSSSIVPDEINHGISAPTVTSFLPQKRNYMISHEALSSLNLPEESQDQDEDSRDSQALIICEDAEVVSSSESSHINQPNYGSDESQDSQGLFISENETRSTQTLPEMWGPGLIGQSTSYFEKYFLRKNPNVSPVKNCRPAEAAKVIKTPRTLLPMPATNQQNPPNYYLLVPVHLPIGFNETSIVPKIDFGVQTVSPPKNTLKSQHSQTDQNSAGRGQSSMSESTASRAKRKRSAETQTGRVRVRISAETQTSVVTKRKRCTRKKFSTQTQTHTPNQSPVKQSPAKSPVKRSSVSSGPVHAAASIAQERRNLFEDEVNCETQTEPDLLVGENFAFVDFEGDSLSDLLSFVESKSAETQTQKGGSSDLFENILCGDASIPNAYLETMDSETQTQFPSFSKLF